MFHLHCLCQNLRYGQATKCWGDTSVCQKHRLKCQIHACTCDCSPDRLKAWSEFGVEEAKIRKLLTSTVASGDEARGEGEEAISTSADESFESESDKKSWQSSEAVTSVAATSMDSLELQSPQDKGTRRRTRQQAQDAEAEQQAEEEMAAKAGKGWVRLAGTVVQAWGHPLDTPPGGGQWPSSEPPATGPITWSDDTRCHVGTSSRLSQ
jgi:hypothetical protein